MSESWRHHPLLTNIMNSKHVFPGWKLGVGAFILYCVYEGAQNAAERQKIFEATKAEKAPAPEHDGHGLEPKPSKWIWTKKTGELPEPTRNPDYK